MDLRMGVGRALAVLLLLLSSAYAFVAGIDGPLIKQEAVEDGNTTLSCDTTPQIADDEIMLLVWYKGDESIYSYDARTDNEWASQSFNTSGRMTIDIRKRPNLLSVSQLRDDDQAVYHCRVEFLLSPTKYTGVELIIIVRPSKPFFLDEFGNKVEGKIGPYFDGDTLMLTCLVIGGRPPPEISWYSGDVLVDASGRDSDVPNIRENELYLTLSRDTSDTVDCVARNTKLAPPVSATVHIELYLPAERVSIKWINGTKDGFLEEGKGAIVQCIADGVYPSPEITWWLKDKHLTHYSNQTYDQLTRRAISYLQLTPTVSDDKAALACMATNLAISQGRNSTADVVTLNVTYVPKVEITVIGTAKLTAIENRTVKFGCEVKANPPADEIIWYFNGVKIENLNILGFNSLRNVSVIQEVKRIHSGQYTCSAVNLLGIGEAEPVDIVVHYPPECKESGITFDETRFICNVDAIPLPNKYLWYFQSDSQIETYNTNSSSITIDKLTVSLATTLNVTCKADNGLRIKHVGCSRIFNFNHLRPQTPQQCDLSYEKDQFHIRCIPVDNATYYEVSVWRQSKHNSSLTLERHLLDSGNSQALVAEGESYLIKGELGPLYQDDEAGAAACNRYGCSRVLLLRPTERLLSAASVPWWKLLLDKSVGIYVGGGLLVVVFVMSTALGVCLAKRTCAKQPAPIIQVVQIDELTRDFIHSARDLKRSSCTLRSRSSDFLDTQDELELTNWNRVPVHHEFEPPPDVTLTVHRESAV